MSYNPLILPDVQIALGRVAGYSAVDKFGVNLDIDTSSVPEDIWNGGGVYTGFPVGAAAACSMVSDSASDTGTLKIYGLKTETSTDYTSEVFAVTGTTPVSIGSWWRVNRMIYDTGDDTTFNVGTISVYQTATPAVIFAAMPAGQSQTTIAAWTVPFGAKGLLRQFTVEVSVGSASAVLEGALWVREYGESPRLQHQFVTSNSSGLFRFAPTAPLDFPERTDITLRVTSSSANNIAAFGFMDILQVKD